MNFYIFYFKSKCHRVWHIGWSLYQIKIHLILRCAQWKGGDREMERGGGKKDIYIFLRVYRVFNCSLSWALCVLHLTYRIASIFYQGYTIANAFSCHCSLWTWANNSTPTQYLTITHQLDNNPSRGYNSPNNSWLDLWLNSSLNYSSLNHQLNDSSLTRLGAQPCRTW